MPRHLPLVIAALASLLLVQPGSPAHAAPASLADFSLEELSELVVTTVSRRHEPLNQAPAAVYVIGADDIRRSGATSLPEALRLAPNLQVAQANASQYAITARGGNALTANNLLVLVDGRIIYTPLYSGVFWDAQHVMMEDVERIEVISGPGATMWGANAVNGVINVITRNAKDTQGTLLSLQAGERESGVALRHGGRLGDQGYYRIYGKRFDRSSTELFNDLSRRDGTQNGQAGFRADWGAQQSRFMLQGDVYGGEINNPSGDREISGAHLLARWYQEFGDGSHLTLQGYYDRTERSYPGSFAENLDTVDLEFQHGLAAQGKHKLLWGAGYRHSRDNITNGPILAFLPAQKNLDYAHLFVQDHVSINPQLDMTAGLKLESNPYTGVEYLPNLRLAYKPDEQSLWWTSLSRAVRTPARIDREFYTFTADPARNIIGGPDFQSEISRVLELGYRGQPTAALSYSLTAFYHHHDRLRSAEQTPAGIVVANMIEGRTAGFELWGSYRVSERWTFSGGWTELDIERRLKPGSQDTIGMRQLGNDPERTLQLRSSSRLTDRHTLDLAVRHVGSLPDPAVSAYTVADARLGWRISPQMEWSLLVRNLFDDKHAEWGMDPNRSVFGRSVMLKLVWQP